MIGSLRNVLVAAGVTAALAAALVATPAAAETVTRPCHGTCGAYFAYDDNLANQGAICVYNRSADTFGDHLINKINVRPPQMNGSHSAMTPVAWRFRVQRWRHGIEDAGHKTIVHTSPWQTSSANTTYTTYLGSGFTWRAWSFTQDPSYAPLDSYRVFVDMRWKYNGSVVGTETIRYDWYKVKRGSLTAIEETWCGSSYDPD